MANKVYFNNLVTLMWLDGEQSDDLTVAQEQLRKNGAHVELFNDPASCEAALHRNPTQVILIVSGRLGQELIPRIHHFPQLATVFVYCMNKRRNKEWSQRYFKVRKVLTDVNKLLRYVQQGFQHLLVQHSNETYPAQILSSNDRSSSKSHAQEASNSNYLSSKGLYNRWREDPHLGFDQLKKQQPELSSSNFRSSKNQKLTMEQRVFIEYIFRLTQSSKPEERRALCDSLKSQYSSNLSILSKINKFEKEYQSSEAILWYTSDTCFYKELNVALRQSNYSRLVDFAFFIRDMYYQLSSEQKKQSSTSNSIRHVYRGQMMSKAELHLLASMSSEKQGFMENMLSFPSMGAQAMPQKEPVIMSSFLSTSRRRDVAEVFLSKTRRRNDETQAVLIHIDVGSNPAATCASIAHLSKMGHGEDEVLFMPGSTFSLNGVIRENEIWIVELKARQVYDQRQNHYEFSSYLEKPLEQLIEMISAEAKQPYELLPFLFDDNVSFLYDPEQLLAIFKTRLPRMGGMTWVDIGKLVFFYGRYEVAEKTFHRALAMATENDSDEERQVCYTYLRKLAQMRGNTEEYKRFSKYENMFDFKSVAHARGLPFDEFAYLENYNEDHPDSDQYVKLFQQLGRMSQMYGF